MTVQVRQAGPARFGMRDLAGLIRIYEASYLRLEKLIPVLPRAGCLMVSRVAAAQDLYLEVLQHHRYTTSLILTYRFPNGDGHAFEPSARIDAYHDVRAAEVVSYCLRRRRHRHAARLRIPGRMPEVDRRWRMNRFLMKWLRFCTYQGHLFLPGVTPVIEGCSLAGGEDAFQLLGE